MKVVSFDLETSNLNADFGIVLCGCFMEYGEGKSRKVKTLRIDDTKSYKKEPWNDRELVCAIRDELEGADIICGWNSKRFDVPFLQGRLMYNNERTMSRIKHIDLMYQARYKVKLHSSRLAAVQSFLDLPDAKTEIKPQVWVKALTGDRKAMDYIATHCVQDVKVLDEVYSRLKHFVTIIHP